MENLPAQTTGFAALSPQQQKEHRVKISVRVRAILGQFWFDAGTPEPVQAIELEGWCDVLESCGHSEIRAAWASYQKTGPRSKVGKLIRPDAGAIFKIIEMARFKQSKETAQAPNVKKVDRVTKERADEIMKQVGYRPKNFGGVQ